MADNKNSFHVYMGVFVEYFRNESIAERSEQGKSAARTVYF